MEYRGSQAQHSLPYLSLFPATCRLRKWFLMKQRSAGKGEKRLTKANKTRWTGVVPSLDTFIDNKDIITNLCSENRAQKDTDKFMPESLTDDDSAWTGDDWQVLDELRGSLQQAHKAATVIQGGSYVTGSIAMKEIRGVFATLREGMYIRAIVGDEER
jgi:hypothetical protein